MNVQQTDTQATTSSGVTFRSIVNDKGRVTIPVEVRKLLNIQPHNAVEFYVGEDDEVRIAPQAMTLEETFGSVKPLQPDKDLEEIIREAKEEHYADRYNRKLKP